MAKLKKGMTVEISDYYYDKKYRNQVGKVVGVWIDNNAYATTTWVEVLLSDNKKIMLTRSMVIVK